MKDATKNRLVNMTLIGACVIVGVISWAAYRQATVHETPPPARPVTVVEPAPRPVPRQPVTVPVIPEEVVQTPVVPAPPVVAVAPRAAPARLVPTPVPPQLIAEPDARVALASVGRDPAAERVWVQAINDTVNLPPRDRKNLIEDLNETGFADPRNLTAEDLPVINARLDLIDSLYLDAADDTNAAAFDEAYKDLLAMRARLTGQ